MLCKELAKNSFSKQALYRKATTRPQDKVNQVSNWHLSLAHSLFIV